MSETLGIDLGTTFSVGAAVGDEGVRLVPDIRDPRVFRTPSVIAFSQDYALVGDSAERALQDHPDLPSARAFKGSMGSDAKVVDDARHRAWTAESLSALVLVKILRDHRTLIGSAPEHTVITIPAQFGDAQRRATLAAAALAGVKSADLVEEPTAAALYYATHGFDQEQTLLVYDLGGGTFDATLLHASPSGVYVLATDGLHDVGGTNFDQMIGEQVAAQIEKQHGIRALEDPASREEILRFARRCKIQFSTPSVHVVREALMTSGRMSQVLVTRTGFLQQIEPLLRRTMASAERCLSAAALDWGHVDKVMLVGGSTLVPAVRELLVSKVSEPATRLLQRQPHQAVAFGAAVYAERIARGQVPVAQRVASADLGLRVRGQQSGATELHVLVARNTVLPAEGRVTLYTHHDDQARMVMDVCQRKGDGPVESVGRFIFDGFLAKRAGYAIEVTLRQDVEGLLHVSAHDPQRNVSIERVVSESGQIASRQLDEARRNLSQIRWL